MIAVPRQTPGPFAFALSASLHVAVLWLLPQIQHAPPSVPLRVTVNLAQAMESRPDTPPPPEPALAQPAQPKPKPRPRAQPAQKPEPRLETPLPLLAVADSAPAADSYVVPEAPPAAVETMVVPSAPVIASAETSENAAEASMLATNGAVQDDAAEVLDGDTAWQAYGRLLYDMVSKNKSYPPIAVRRHWEGRAKVSARFKLGQLVEITLLEPGSGHAVLDRAALEMVRSAAAQISPQPGIARKSFTVVIPVDFKLTG